MNCYSCGADTGDQLGLCAACREKRDRQHQHRIAQASSGSSVLGDAKASAQGPKKVTPMLMGVDALPAGFWLRFLAYWLDSLILGIVLNVIAAVSAYPIFSLLSFTLPNSIDNSPAMENAMTRMLVAFALSVLAYITVIMLAAVLYSILFEASRFKATPGKMLLGLQVTTIEGKTLTKGQALLRSTAKIISAITFCIGYIIIAVHPEKLSFHDMFSKTRVIKGDNYSGSKIIVAIIVLIVLCVLSKIVPNPGADHFNKLKIEYDSHSGGAFSRFEQDFKKSVQERGTRNWNGF